MLSKILAGAIVAGALTVTLLYRQSPATLQGGMTGDNPVIQTGGNDAPVVTAGSDLAELKINGKTHTVTGPYAHKNLAVYLVHFNAQDTREFITLEDGLKSGEVTVSESPEGGVQQLQIENRSAKHLFLQEGDLLRGGKQDRTVQSTLVIAPKSPKQPLPAFCVEPNRWEHEDSARVVASVQGVERGNTNRAPSSANADASFKIDDSHVGGGDTFRLGRNTGLADKETRQAAKYRGSQGAVWANVAEVKKDAGQKLHSAQLNSSLTETFDTPDVVNLSNEMAAAFEKIVKENPTAAGAAIAVNGKIQEINIYPNHGVLAGMLPRLLKSYAVDAAMKPQDAKTALVWPKPAAVAEFGADKTSKAKNTKTIRREGYKTVLLETSGADASFVLRDGDEGVVHYQVLDSSEKGKGGGADSSFVIRDGGE